jgi:hypothetical protein
MSKTRLWLKCSGLEGGIPLYLLIYYVLMGGGLISRVIVESANLHLGGSYMPGGLILKGGLICQIIRYVSTPNDH